MTEITGTQSTIMATESKPGLVSLSQKSATGEDQVIFLDLHQAENLANWFMQYLKIAREEIAEE